MYLSEDVFEQFRANMKALGYYPVIMRLESLEAAKLFPDGFLDLVYIDGDHFRIAEDIDAWTPKVKAGGILCGHDWQTKHIRECVKKHFPDVKLASQSLWVVNMKGKVG